MSGEGNAADWITATATALTAIFAGFGGLAAWLSYRREVRKDLPVIEAEMSWSGNFVLTRIRIQNTLPTTLVVVSARVKHPRNCRISPGLEVDRHGRYDLTTPKAAANYYTEVNCEIFPFGSADAARLDLAVFPLSSWPGGKVAIELTIIDNSSVTRRRRITVQRRMPARPHNNTADVARSED